MSFVESRGWAKPLIAAASASAVAAAVVVVIVVAERSRRSAPPSAAASTAASSPISPTPASTTTAAPVLASTSAPVASSSAPPVSSSAPPASATPSATGPRGLTTLATLIAGKPNDATGKGVPGAAATASLGRSSVIATGADGSIFAIDASLNRLLHIKDGKVTVAYAKREKTGPIGGLAVSRTGKVVLLTPDGLIEITGDGKSTSIATLAQLGSGVTPGDEAPLAFDGVGNLYIANSNGYTVLRRAVDGSLTRVAGTGQFADLLPPKGDGGPATAAPMAHMTAMVVDRSGNLLIGQAQGALRMVAVDGTLSTIAGAGTQTMTNGAATFPPDGTKAVDVGLAAISSLAVDSQGRIYVGDSQSGVIMRINADDTTTFIAGDQPGATDPTLTGSPADQTRFEDAAGLAFDKSSALLVAEAGLIVKIDGVAAG
jgi:hypothetical protein